MRPYRLRKYITGTGVLLAGAGILAGATAQADDSGPRARPARSAPTRESGPVARPSFRPAPSNAGSAWRGGVSGSPYARSGGGASPFNRQDGPSAFGGGVVPSRPSPFTPRGGGNDPRPTPSPFATRGDRGNTPAAPTPSWRSGGSTQSGNDVPRRSVPRVETTSNRTTAPGGTTPGIPDGFGQGRHDRSPAADTGASWRPPSRTSGSPGRTTPGAVPPAPRPNTRGGNPNERDTNPYERSTNRNEIPGPSWRITPGRMTVIDPAMHHRPPQVDRSRWSGTGGMRYGGRDFRRVPIGYADPWCVYQTPIFSGIRFYYPFYYVGPFQAGFYYSPFWFYGSLFPTYIYPERVIVVERRTYIRDVVKDDSFYDPYSSTTTTLRDTMADIRSAWLDGDGGLLLRHINDAFPVRILQKGDYKYSLEPDDYRDITKDALNRVKTTNFEWTNVDRQGDDVVVLEARHTFRDDDGDSHTIRLTYTVEKARGSWWITQTDVAPW